MCSPDHTSSWRAQLCHVSLFVFILVTVPLISCLFPWFPFIGPSRVTFLFLSLGSLISPRDPPAVRRAFGHSDAHDAASLVLLERSLHGLGHAFMMHECISIDIIAFSSLPGWLRTPLACCNRTAQHRKARSRLSCKVACRWRSFQMMRPARRSSLTTRFARPRAA